MRDTCSHCSWERGSRVQRAPSFHAHLFLLREAGFLPQAASLTRGHGPDSVPRGPRGPRWGQFQSPPAGPRAPLAPVLVLAPSARRIRVAQGGGDSQAVRAQGGRKGVLRDPPLPARKLRAQATCPPRPPSSEVPKDGRKRAGTVPQPQLPRVDARALEGPPGGWCGSPGSRPTASAPSPARRSPSRPRRARADPRGRPAGRGGGEKAGGQGRRERPQLPCLKETELPGAYRGQCPLCGCGSRRVCDTWGPSVAHGTARPSSPFLLTTVASLRPRGRPPARMDGGSCGRCTSLPLPGRLSCPDGEPWVTAGLCPGSEDQLRAEILS